MKENLKQEILEELKKEKDSNHINSAEQVKKKWMHRPNKRFKYSDSILDKTGLVKINKYERKSIL